jgi:hypothetical protein
MIPSSSSSKALTTLGQPNATWSALPHMAVRLSLLRGWDVASKQGNVNALAVFNSATKRYRSFTLQIAEATKHPSSNSQFSPSMGVVEDKR